MATQKSVKVPADSKEFAKQDASSSSSPTPARRRDYPDPDLIAKMASRLNLEEMPKVMRGPKCFNCFEWGTFFNCEGCDRSYHRECVFMNHRGYPLPVFNEPVEKAQVADYGVMKLLKCPNCLVEENTLFPQLKEVSKEDLNKALAILASQFEQDFEELLVEIPTNGPFPVTLAEISKKAKKGLYNSLEGFYGDYRRIVYNLVTKYSVESEAGEVGEKILETVGTEMTTLSSCLECYLKRWNADGQLLNKEKYIPINVQVCKTPHPLVWSKEPNFPYWPSKLLASGAGQIIVQCFREKAAVRVVPTNSKGYDVRTYSLKAPGNSQNQHFKGALKDCAEYLVNLKARFGEAGVVIPKVAEQFDGDMNALLRAQLPSFQLPK